MPNVKRHCVACGDLSNSFGRMVTTKSATIPVIRPRRFISTPWMKEAMTPSLNPRTISPRIAELPSLRYGRIGATSSLSGPLRVAPSSHSTGGGHYTRTHPSSTHRISTNKLHHSGGSNNSGDFDAIHKIHNKTTRRVRFDLSNNTTTTSTTSASTTTSLTSTTTQSISSSSTSQHHQYEKGNNILRSSSNNNSTATNRNDVRRITHNTSGSSSSSSSNTNSVTSGGEIYHQSHHQWYAPSSRQHHHQYNNNNGNVIVTATTAAAAAAEAEQMMTMNSHQQYKQQQMIATTTTIPTSSSSAAATATTTRRDATNNNTHTWQSHDYHQPQQPQSTTKYHRNSRFIVTPTIQSDQILHNTEKYIRGTLSPTSNASTGAGDPSSSSSIAIETGLLLQAARDCDEQTLKDLLKRAQLVGIPDNELNARDSTGRTPVSYIVSNGSVDILEAILQIPGIDVNLPDNEGNTPLHFAAQAGQVECLNFLVSRCPGVEIDARNNLGFTPLMKAALQGRNKCAKLLLFAGASPTLRDTGRGLRAEQWARYCGRYVCAEMIEKFARHRLLDRNTSTGRWGSEPDIGTRVLMGKVVPTPPQPPPDNHHRHSSSIKNKIRRVFRTSSGPSNNAQTNNNHPETSDTSASSRLVTQLTTAALCASTPVLPTGPSNTVPTMIKSLVRPLTVPKLQVTLVNNNGDIGPTTNLTNGLSKSQGNIIEQLNEEKISNSIIKPTKVKKKK